jgi:hypothetical protein
MPIEKHGRGVEPAWQMLEIFASQGVRAFDLTQTSLDGKLRSFTAGLSYELLRGWIPKLLRSAVERQHNVIVRPKRTDAALIQLDDVGEAALEHLRRVAFLALTTSWRNHQAWVAVRDGGADFARRLRQGSGADPSASGAARLAGSFNFKPQYAPDFPVVSIRQATPGRVVTCAQLEALGLVAVADSGWAPMARVGSWRRAKHWPSYERCLENAPPAHRSDRPDISRADFTFCLLAIDWGWNPVETCQRLMQHSRKARERGEAYARLTTERAAQAIDRRQRR